LYAAVKFCNLLIVGLKLASSILYNKSATMRGVWAESKQ